ncbi:MAG: Nif3-like dinuclear metal center hexameric protein [Akkermansia sp.]
MPVPLHDIVRFFDDTLHTAQIKDYPHALNGLQVENRGGVTRIAMAVDASESAIRAAIEAKADLLLVHHGLFWGGLQPVTRATYQKLALCIEHHLAIYSSHLPLDIHPIYGNNAILAKKCELSIIGDGIPMGGNILGYRCLCDVPLNNFLHTLQAVTDMEVRAYLSPEANELNSLAPLGEIMICSGGAGDELPVVGTMGIKTFLTGEGSHWTIPMARELGINLIYAGHYATETFGVTALGQAASERFSLPAEFIHDEPKAVVISPLLP